MSLPDFRRDKTDRLLDVGWIDTRQKYRKPRTKLSEHAIGYASSSLIHNRRVMSRHTEFVYRVYN
jgi:hypothetical protein